MRHLKLKRLLGSLVWRAYESAPAGAESVLHFGRRYLLPVLRYAVPLVRVHGRAVADGEPGSVLLAGAGPQLLHLGRQLLAGEVRIEPLGSCPIHALARTLCALGKDDELTLARVGQPLAGLIAGQRFLRVPTLVDVWVDASDREQVQRRMSRTMRHTAQALLTSGYAWTETHDPIAFERFYDRYYLPFVKARHDELAVVRERPVLRRQFGRGGVLWIIEDREEVAGLLYRVDGDVLSLLAVGTLQGSLKARRKGLLDAVKLFGIEFALQRGLKWVDLGGCMPSPCDGSLANKRAWGGELRERRDSHHDLLLRWPRFTPRIARFLADAPVFIREPGGLAALAAVPTGDPRSALRLWRQWQMPGLERLHVVSPDGWRDRRQGDAPPPAGRLWLCHAGTVEEVLASSQDAAGPTDSSK